MRLNRRIKTGGTARDNLRRAAAAGSAVARAALEGPECPETLEYMLGWAHALHGRSGVGMEGFGPLTYSTVADWARLQRIDIQPDEVEALMVIDAAMLNPGEDEPVGGDDA